MAAIGPDVGKIIICMENYNLDLQGLNHQAATPEDFS